MSPELCLALEARAAKELAKGEFAAAFRFADRRCRMAPPPQAYSYVLRAEALKRLGKHTLALDDLGRALALAPEDVAANRRRFLWTNGADRAAAAAVLVVRDRDLASRQAARAFLWATGRRRLADLVATPSRLRGWAAWDGASALDVTVSDEDRESRWRLQPDPHHPLRGRGSAVEFDLPRPSGVGSQTIRVCADGIPIATVRAGAPSNAPRFADRAPRRGDATRAIAIVVPIYADYDATAACIASLLEALPDAPGHRLVLVDDATPDPRLRDHLRDLGCDPRVELLVNSENLGFVGTVNRALAHIDDGDVILVNADTLVPKGFVERLAAAAHSAPRIGTVTPLSNNGEFTSFPCPNQVNPLGSAAEVQVIDRAAARCNRDVVVDLPSGIGFCLYITRACLDAVGPLSEDYHRGYLEDADFCLRARDHGFRSVCAASVYVGHAGGRSFAAAKRALVVRNLGILERRFPSHRAECAAFMAADPLRPARAAMERDLGPSAANPVLLVTPPDTSMEIAQARASDLRQQGIGSLVIESRHDGRTIAITDPAGAVPQALHFDLGREEDRGAIAHYLRKTAPARVELLVPSALPDALITTMVGIEVPIDLFVTGPCPDLTPPLARRIRFALAPDDAAMACAQALPGRSVALADHPMGLARTGGSRLAQGRLGILPLADSWETAHLARRWAQAVRSLRPDLLVTILGPALDAREVMADEGVTVTGRLAAADLPDAIDLHDIGPVILVSNRPWFGLPAIRFLRGSPHPLAGLDWFRGAVPPRIGDLAISPEASFDSALRQVVDWLPARATPTLRSAA